MPSRLGFFLCSYTESADGGSAANTNAALATDAASRREWSRMAEA